MTRRPVQQARRITDRKLIADWPGQGAVRLVAHPGRVDHRVLALLMAAVAAGLFLMAVQS